MSARGLVRIAIMSVAASMTILSFARPSDLARGAPEPSRIPVGELTDVSADSATDAWAIGDHGGNEPIVMHWDGVDWTLVAIETPGADFNRLLDVVALSPTDVWVVGDYGSDDDSYSKTLVEHWDGSGFAVFPSPNPNGSRASLETVSAASSNDVWAAGRHGDRGCLMEHWDGATWSVAPSPGRRSCSSVSAVGSNDVYASHHESLMHWDGQSWARVVSRPQGENLAEVEAVSDHDVWVIEDYPEGDGHAMQWNGRRWEKVLDPCLFSGLSGVAPIAKTDVWAVGLCHGGAYTSVVWHWNDGHWSQAIGSKNGYLLGVGGSAPNDVWAVGSRGQKVLLIEHWNGSTWQVYP